MASAADHSDREDIEHSQTKIRKTALHCIFKLLARSQISEAELPISQLLDVLDLSRIECLTTSLSILSCLLAKGLVPPSYLQNKVLICHLLKPIKSPASRQACIILSSLCKGLEYNFSL